MLKFKDKIDRSIPSKYRYWVNGEWVEEDDMADSFRQFTLVHYLVSVLSMLFRSQACIVKGNIFIYPRGRYGERVAPDVMVIKGISLTEEEQDELFSWAIDPPEQPAPNVAIEVSSEATWNTDILPQNKPSHYAWLGVLEYFAYDPLGVWEGFEVKLRGWRTVDGQAVEIEPNEQGWLWSNELSCWLVADNQYLRLCNSEGMQIMSEGEYGQFQEELRYEAENRRLAAEAKIEQEQLARAEAEAKIEQEQLARAEAEQRKIEAEQRAEQERQAREELERKLAELQAKINQNNASED